MKYETPISIKLFTGFFNTEFEEHMWDNFTIRGTTELESVLVLKFLEVVDFSIANDSNGTYLDRLVTEIT